MSRKECPAWSPTATGVRGCSLPNKHTGEHRYTDALQMGTPAEFSGFGIGKMHLTLPKGAPFIEDGDEECY